MKELLLWSRLEETAVEARCWWQWDVGAGGILTVKSGAVGRGTDSDDSMRQQEGHRDSRKCWPGRAPGRTKLQDVCPSHPCFPVWALPVWFRLRRKCPSGSL